MENIFDEVEKQADTGSKTKASWTGKLSINLPGLNLGPTEFHLRAGKAKGSQDKANIKHMDTQTGREVVSKEVVRFYRYTQDAEGKRSEPIEVGYEEMKAKVRYPSTDGEAWLISGRKESRFFDKSSIEDGNWIEVPPERVKDFQDTEEVSEFERTHIIEVGEENFVPLSRVPEYKVSETYHLTADTDKKVNESPNRVRNLARTLLEKQVALVGFFCWRKGYNYYTSVIFPYERSDGRLWLLMATTEGILQLDETWSLEEIAEKQPALAPVPMAPKPRVKLAK